MSSSATGIAEQVLTLLDAATPAAELSDDEVRSRLVECEQAIAMLQAEQAGAMVQMGVRARAADCAEIDVTGRQLWSTESREEFVADEIAVLLACTKVAAATRYGTALNAARCPAIRQAWRSGHLEARKVATICEQIELLNADDAERLASEALSYATRPGRPRTAPQLREWLRRRVIAIDPDAAEARRQRALADRRVVITPGDDGMSELWALLPSLQARQIQEALTVAAHQSGADDRRTMDQRRVDSLVDLLLGHTVAHAVDVQLIVSADTIMGRSGSPAWITGAGPVTANQARELMQAGPTEPSCPASSPEEAAGEAEPAGWATDEPAGELTIGRHVTLRRLLTDPRSGVLTDIAEERYRPSAALDRAVRARDVTCRFPGCRRAAFGTGTDLDHTVPWPVGETSAANLAVLCRRHHRLKHRAGWQVSLAPDGTMVWATPTGRTFETLPWQYTDPPLR